MQACLVGGMHRENLPAESMYCHCAGVHYKHGAKPPPIQGLYLSTEDSTRMQPLYWHSCAKASCTLQSGMHDIHCQCVCARVVVCARVCVCLNFVYVVY